MKNLQRLVRPQYTLVTDGTGPAAVAAGEAAEGTVG